MKSLADRSVPGNPFDQASAATVDTRLWGHKEIIMKLEPNIDRSVQGLTECIALFEDAKTRRLVAERVDELLEPVTSYDPFVQPHVCGNGNVFSFIPEFAFDIHGLEVKVAVGLSSGRWYCECDRLRWRWVLNPCDKDTLKEDVVGKILAIKREIEGDSSIHECEHWSEIWRRLSDADQDAIYAGISEAEWRDSGRDKIRSSLISSIFRALDEEIEAWKEALDRIIQAQSLLTKMVAEPVCSREIKVVKTPQGRRID
jgi:hypothetical protein